MAAMRAAGAELHDLSECLVRAVFAGAVRVAPIGNAAIDLTAAAR